MGKWRQVLENGRSFRQWVPTEQGEKLPTWDAWDGCPICGANALPHKDDPEGLHKRLNLVHDRRTHEKWANERREFQGNMGDVRQRMTTPTEPEAA